MGCGGRSTLRQSLLQANLFTRRKGIFDSNPLAVVPGTLWHTRFNNFAPRVGAAYQITPKTVARAAFGVFYDLGYGSFGGIPLASSHISAQALSLLSSPVPFDLTNPAFQPPPLSTAIDANVIYMVAVDPNLRLPLILQWNAAIQRELGTNQTLSATYVGADDMRLLREDFIRPPLLVGFGNGGTVYAIRNAGYSHFNAFQIQFQRRMSHGVQALISYNLAKSSDLGSADSNGLDAGSVSQVVLPPLTPSDLRHTQLHRRSRLLRAAGASVGPTKQRNSERLGSRRPGARKFGATDQYHRRRDLRPRWFLTELRLRSYQARPSGFQIRPNPAALP